MRQIELKYLLSAVALAGLPACAQTPAPAPTETASISAHLSGTAFVTTQLDASISFYEDLLGFQERRRTQLTTDAGTAVFGAAAGSVLDYVVLVPAAFSEEAPTHPGLNFVGISRAPALSLPQDPTRAPHSGELVMAFEVTNLEAIRKLAEEREIPIVTPVALSATGKSRTLTLLDPNGIRVQLYEYVKTGDPQ